MKALKVIAAVFALIAIITACQNEGELNYSRYYANGQAIYQSNCQNCHGQNGEGLGELIPPLTDSVFLKAHRHELACYLHNGLKQTIVVKGKTYEGQAMPQQNLSPIEAAEVITYVLNSFGNKAGLHDNATVQKDLAGCK